MTEENHWDEQVRSALAPALRSGQLTIIDEVETLFGSLCAAYPVKGTKIDWSGVPGSSHRLSKGAKQGDFEQFFHANASRMGLNTPAFYLSDSALDFAIAGNVGSFGQWLPAILDNPQHHYFAAMDFSWCLALTMEGDMTFGFRP